MDDSPTPAFSCAATPGRVFPTVKHFRQIVLWPLQLMPLARGARRTHEQLIAALAPEWRILEDEFTGSDPIEERHYREFVTFLPHVQRFLYGDVPGTMKRRAYGEAPLRVYRRDGIDAVRITFQHDIPPVVCRIAHVDLYFPYDVDLLILALEIHADDLPLDRAEEVMYRFGRAYPAGWSEDGIARHCPLLVEWLDADGHVLAASDYQDRDRYLDFVGRRRSAAIASHWEWLLQPFVPAASTAPGPLRFRPVEYYRMPLMAFLALDDLDVLDRTDYVRLAYAMAPSGVTELPYSEDYLADFEARHCNDRYFGQAPRSEATTTRFLTCGHAFTIVAGGQGPFVTDGERGLLGEFRHQYFLLFLIAHFHKATLLMISDRQVLAIKRLDVARATTIPRFRRDIYAIQESFLRFVHRYWIHDISDKAQSSEMFEMLLRHLKTRDLYDEVRGEILDMVQYLDSDTLRRQSTSMLRLTVTTILGLIGTTTTGFLGMNLIDEANADFGTKLVFFLGVLVPTVALTMATIAFSRPLTHVFDRLSEEWWINRRRDE